MMKLRSTTPVSDLSFMGRVLIIAAVVVMAVAVPVQLFTVHPASADEFDDKIRVLNENIANYRNQANTLRQQADTLQNALNQLSADRAAIQLEVDRNQLQHDQLVADIAAMQKRIDENRRVSGDLIVKSSLSDDVPLVVRLAASENLADYIDGEASRISVRDTIVQKTEESDRLKKELEVKQAEVKKVLDEQKFKRDELASKEAEQQRLIDDTRGDEAEYNKLISSASEEVKKVQTEQQAAYERARAVWTNSGGTYITRGGSGGGYPWANAYWNNNIGYSTVVDDWDLLARQCVSYVAWKLDNQGHRVQRFNGRGHAYQWPSTTSGYTSQKTGVPQKGSAAVIPYSANFPYGHVMYVEDVHGDGSIKISEYNFAGPGIYSERIIPAGQYSHYIFLTFPRR